MTTLINKIKHLSKGAKLGLAGLSIATLVGTFGGNQGGFPPIYNKKVGTWGGINIGAYTKFQENSKFYGISLGLFNFSQVDSRGNPISNYFYGIQVGMDNITNNLTGMQVGVGNVTNNLTGMQVGILNKNQNDWNLIIGYGNKLN